MGVLAIWRYPVKAMLGELLDAVAVGASGLAGDRRWVVADAVTGQRIASKRGRTDPRLRACRARLDGDGRLAVTLPGGETTHDVAGALSDLLGRRVTLVEEGRPHHDFAPLHVVTTGVLERMRAVAPGGDWDPRRFRPNLLLDGGEDRDLLGCELRARSGLRLHVELPTPRCVVPTSSQGTSCTSPSVSGSASTRMTETTPRRC